MKYDLNAEVTCNNETWVLGNEANSCVVGTGWYDNFYQYCYQPFFPTVIHQDDRVSKAVEKDLKRTRLKKC